MTDAQRQTIAAFFEAADPGRERVRVSMPHILPGWRRATTGAYEARCGAASIIVDPNGKVRG